MDNRGAPCPGPLATAEEEIPAQEVAPEKQHGTEETAVKAGADVGLGEGGGGVDKAEAVLAGLGIVKLNDVQKQTKKTA